MRSDLVGYPVWSSEVESAITVVDDGEPIERIKIPWPGNTPGQLGGRGPYRGRAKAGSGTVSGRGIERHAGNCNIDAFEVTGIFPA